jgi:large subunit ribosomal protein L24
MITKIKKNDKVKVIAGKDKGKIATVLKVLKDRDLVLVEGVNMVKKHVKPGSVSKEGGIVSIEKPIHVSNVMYYSEKAGRPVRVGFKVTDGKKFRICKKTGEILDK